MPKDSRSSLRAIGWVLLVVAVFIFLASIPTTWFALELANQEYLKLWPSRRAIYDIEIDGVPLSNDSAIRRFGSFAFVMWLTSFGLVLIARRFFNHSPRKNS